jgi:hypothetical protein
MVFHFLILVVNSLMTSRLNKQRHGFKAYNTFTLLLYLFYLTVTWPFVSSGNKKSLNDVSS